MYVHICNLYTSYGSAPCVKQEQCVVVVEEVWREVFYRWLPGSCLNGSKESSNL